MLKSLTMMKTTLKIQLLTVSTFIFFLNGLGQNAIATTTEVKSELEEITQYRHNLPQHIIETFTTEIVILTGLGIALGTGLSRKNPKTSSRPNLLPMSKRN
ncbi:MAG: hypothetical protein QNJ54_36340 [Prochloraceae cyanobacterium]|nr:hypothetical protein [Prochloraceae cyanobacterium]